MEIDSYIRTDGQTSPQILFRVQKGIKNDALARKTSDPDLTHTTGRYEKLSPRNYEVRVLSLLG